MLNGLDLFSGIGGLTLALSPWVRTVAYCESDRYATAVLLSRASEGRLHNAPIWNDVRTLRGEDLPAVEAITAGWPCQDISIAGTRNGRKMLEGERSGLIFEVLRLVDELRPMLVFLENVSEAKKLSEKIRGHFKELQYELRDTTKTVYDVGGYHKRERWFALAYPESIGMEGLRAKRFKKSQSLDIPLLPLRNSHGQWKVEPDVRRIDDGVPNKSHRLKALGNAVVPLQARKAFEELMGLTKSRGGDE